MNHTDNGLLMESGSSLGTFMDCPKLYEMKYIKRLDSPYYAATLGFGSFIHAFAEDFFKWKKESKEELALPPLLWSRSEQHESFLQVLNQMAQDTLCSTEETTRRLWQQSPMPLTLEPQPYTLAMMRLHLTSPTAWITLMREVSRFPSQTEEIVLDCALALAVSREWQAHWNSKSGDLSNKALIVVQPEKEWALPVTISETPTAESSALSTKSILLGKSDGDFRHQTYPGEFLYELKTSGDTSREVYKMKLEQDKQINANLLAMQYDGLEPKGVIYDIIWKPAIRLKKDRKTMPDETREEFYARIVEEYRTLPEKYFERLMVFRSQSDLAEYGKDLSEQFHALDSARTRNHFYRNTNSCEKFGRLCQFFKSCMGGAPEEEMEHFRVKDRKLPELSKEIQQEN